MSKKTVPHVQKYGWLDEVSFQMDPMNLGCNFVLVVVTVLFCGIYYHLSPIIISCFQPFTILYLLCFIHIRIKMGGGDMFFFHVHFWQDW